MPVRLLKVLANSRLGVADVRLLDRSVVHQRASDTIEPALVPSAAKTQRDDADPGSGGTLPPYTLRANKVEVAVYDPKSWSWSGGYHCCV